MSRLQRWVALPLAAALMALTLTGCGSQAGSDSEEAGAARPTVAIGSKAFTEQLLIGEMYALILEENGYQVERKLNLGGTMVAHEALVAGEIDLYPEYTGTGLMAILKKEPMKDRQKVYETVKAGYQEKWNMVWLDPAPMNNTQAIAVTQETAEKYDMYTLSKMSEVAPNLVMAGVPGFTEREDGLKGLQETYGGFKFKDVKLVNFGVKYRALIGGEADATVAFGTDGQIKGYDLVVLEDDKGLWPPYQVAPVIRGEVLAEAPDIADLLNPLAPLLTDETMQTLNWEVDGNQREYDEVAREFLQEKGLIE